MKILRNIIVIVFLLSFAKFASAQQAPYYTQYMFNDYLVNPAVAGTYNYFQIRANYRLQWIGFDGAPSTFSLTGYGPLKKRPMGYGGYIYNDVTGPESRLSAGGSYAYNIAINDAMRISGGLSLGIIQYKLDGTSMRFDDEIYDPALTGGVESRIIPDANVGFYLYSTYYYVGISAHQLFGNKYNVHEELDSVNGVSRLTQHVYLSGGYNIILNRDFLLSPSAMIRYTPTQFQFEINAKCTYQRLVWLGLSYRYKDAVSVLLGYNHEDKIYFGVSYDVTTTDLRKYSNGTVEIMLGYRFNTIK